MDNVPHNGLGFDETSGEVGQMTELMNAGSFCPNPDCAKHGQTEGNDIVRFGKSAQGRQRWRCNACGRVFNENKGTLFYRKRTPGKDIMEALSMLAEGTSVNSVSRAKGVKASTVAGWAREAGEHAEAVAETLQGDYGMGASQIDRLWSSVGHQGSKKRPSGDGA